MRRARDVDWALVAGLVVVVAAAAVPRLVHLDAGLPGIVGPDEPTVMDRAVAIAEGRGGPTEFDWPPLSMYLLAGAMRAAGRVGDYTFARGLFAGVSLAAVALSGVAGAALADGVGPGRRRLTAWLSAALVGVSYLSVRLSRQAHPEHLQVALMLAAFLATLAYDRHRRWPWIVAAGALAGAAGASKYLGVLVAVPALVLAVRNVRHLALLAVAGAAGFAAGAPSALTHPGRFWAGVRFQLGHQREGHLGYDGLDSGWWFHLTESLPGNWGWPLTALAVAGVVAVLARGTRAQRLAVAVVVPTFAVVGASRVRFPHYVLLVVPFLAPLAVVAAGRLLHLLRRPPLVTAAGAVLAAVALGPTLVADARLVRAAGATDTRTLATSAVARLPGDDPVWTERYGVLDTPRTRPVADFGRHPEVLDCRCYAVVSSYMEDRYRREPRRYADEVAVYDSLRRRGRVVATIAPPRHLDYDWDLVPRWGLDRIGLTGDVGAVGPTITILDLRRR